MRVLGGALLAFHLSLVSWLMLRPLSVPWVYSANVRPLATIDRILLTDPVAGSRTIGTELLLLAPLGVLLPLLAGRLDASALGSFTRTVFCGAAVSFGIECWQTQVPGRVFDVDTVILNAVGVAVAHLLVVPGTRSRLRRRRATRHRVPRDLAPAPAATPVAAPPRPGSQDVLAVRAPAISYEVAAHLHRGM